VTSKLNNIVVVKRKKQESAVKQMVQRKIHDNNLLLLSLKIFVSLLSNGQTPASPAPEAEAEAGGVGGESGDGGAPLRPCRRSSLLMSPADKAGSALMDVEEAAAVLARAQAAAEDASGGGSSLPDYSDRRVAVAAAGPASAGAGTGSLSLSSPLLPKLCSLLRRIWVGYLPDEAVPLPLKLEVILRGMADVMVVLSRLVAANASAASAAVLAELRRTAHSFASQFPYTVLESSCSPENNKKKAKQAARREEVAVAAEAPPEVDMEEDEEEEREREEAAMSARLRGDGDGDMDMDMDDEEGDASDTDAASLASSKAGGGAASDAYNGTIDMAVLNDAKKKFLILNIVLSETVINLYSEGICLEYLSLKAAKEKAETQLYLRAYGSVQLFMRRELTRAIPMLSQGAAAGSQDSDLTPREFYQSLFVCHKLSYMQLNKVASLNLSGADLHALHPGLLLDSAFNLPSVLSTLLESFLRLGTSFRCKGYIPFIEGCVECICGVADETVAHKSFEIEAAVGLAGAGAGAGENSAGDITAGLSAALCLMSSLLNEPGRLTRMLTESSVRFMAVVDCAYDDATTTTTTISALQKFQTAVLQLFQPADEEDEESVALYNRAPLATRLRMLDLWVAVAPAAGFMRGAEDVFECLQATVFQADWHQGAPCASEIAYFLRLFHMRCIHIICDVSFKLL
jgi:hypothetical protein